MTDPEPIPRRTKLQEVLEGIIGEDDRVYFQPPENLTMKYPCIRYKLDDADDEYADNGLYLSTMGYQVTLIDRKPNSEFLAKIRSLPMCSFDRSYNAAGLNHYVFNLFF